MYPFNSGNLPPPGAAPVPRLDCLPDTTDMRLFLLPISTRRTLLYCQKSQVLPAHKQTLVEKATEKGAKLWSDWEKRDGGWQRKVVDYGNYALRRIPYEEWGLKSVPPLSAKRRAEEVLGKDKNILVFPRNVIPETKALNVLKTLGTEREALHKSRLMWCFVGMPISAPFALVPIIPNLPFFYLVFRAWSHWRALAGGRHIQFLVDKNILQLAPSAALDSIYPPLLPSMPPSQHTNADRPEAQLSNGTANLGDDEQILLSQEKGRVLAQSLAIPELEVELERAIWQVERSISKKSEELADKQKKR